MDLVVAVVADEQPLEVMKPGEGALDDPAGRGRAHERSRARTCALLAVFADYGVAAPQRERYRREAVRNPFCQGRLYGEARICGQVSASPLCALREGGPTSCGQNVRPPRDSRQHTYRAWAKRGESPSSFATTEWRGQDPERCQTLVVLQVSKRPLDGGAATVEVAEPLSVARDDATPGPTQKASSPTTQREKTCRTVQADAQDDWFGPDQRREQTTERKVVSRL